MGAIGTNIRSRPLDAVDGARNSVLPLFPTLVTAVVIGALSLLCQQPTTVDPARAATPEIVASTLVPYGSDGFQRPSSVVALEPRLPAALAFACAYPIVPDAEAERVAASTKPGSGKSANAQVARSIKRPCNGQKCAEWHRAEIAPVPAPSRMRPAPSRAALTEGDGDDGLTTGSILPLAETAIESVRSLGRDTAQLGGAVLQEFAVLP